jgi:hypothetical protein
MVIKGSKTVDGRDTKAENDAWAKFERQGTMLMSTPERIEDAFRTAWRGGRALEKKKHDAFVERLKKGHK